MCAEKGIRDQLADTLLSRGSMYHCYSDIAGKGKWLAVLNDEWPPANGVAVYAFMTTSVDRFARAKIPPTAYLRIEIGDYQFCTQPTILDLTDIHQRAFGEILYGRMFNYAGTLTAAHLGSRYNG